MSIYGYDSWKLDNDYQDMPTLDCAGCGEPVYEDEVFGDEGFCEHCFRYECEVCGNELPQGDSDDICDACYNASVKKCITTGCGQDIDINDARDLCFRCE